MQRGQSRKEASAAILEEMLGLAGVVGKIGFKLHLGGKINRTWVGLYVGARQRAGQK